MKLIHTSDWHLGHVLYGYDREAEQRDFLRQLVAIVKREQPDALLVSGDIYHTSAPSTAAVRLYNEWMLKLADACPSMSIIVIAGNHDSQSRLESGSMLWQRAAGVHVLGRLARNDAGLANLERHIIEVHNADKQLVGLVAAVPYCFAYNYPQVSENEVERTQLMSTYYQALLDRASEMNVTGVPVVLMSHLAVSGSDFTGHDREQQLQHDSVALSVLGQGYDYAALGHIHRPQHPGGDERVRYCGTPLAVSFDEQCAHGVSIVSIAHHGDKPVVSHEGIVNLHPLHTIPAQAAPWEEALEALRKHARQGGEASYVRMHVQGFQLPPDAEAQAVQALSGSECRFCLIKKSFDTNNETNPMRHLSMGEFKRLTPLEIAQDYILRKNGTEMQENQQQLFNEVYNEINELNRK